MLKRVPLHVGERLFTLNFILTDKATLPSAGLRGPGGPVGAGGGVLALV